MNGLRLGFLSFVFTIFFIPYALILALQPYDEETDKIGCVWTHWIHISVQLNLESILFVFFGADLLATRIHDDIDS